MGVATSNCEWKIASPRDPPSPLVAVSQLILLWPNSACLLAQAISLTEINDGPPIARRSIKGPIR
jgi:hypothetical protein